MKKSTLLAAAVGFSIPIGLSLHNAAATTSTFAPNVDNLYTNGSNWGPTPGVPDLTNANTAVINSGSGAVQYTGGDFVVQNGGVLQIDGGSFTQVAPAGGWMQLHTGGTINVAGGSFDVGTSARFNNLNGTLNISAGTATLKLLDVTSGGLVHTTGGATTTSDNVNLASGATLQVSGGTFAPFNLAPSTGSTVTIDGGTLTSSSNFAVNAGVNFSLTAGSLTLTGTSEFKPNNAGTVTLGGGTLNAYVMSFDGVNTITDFTSGFINLSGGDHFNGIFGGNGTSKYVNFTLNSTGSMFIDNLTSLGLSSLLSNSIAYNGVFNASLFNTVPTGAGYTITAITSVPEPSTYAAIIGAACFGLIALRRRRLARIS